MPANTNSFSSKYSASDFENKIRYFLFTRNLSERVIDDIIKFGKEDIEVYREVATPELIARRLMQGFASKSKKFKSNVDVTDFYNFSLLNSL